MNIAQLIDELATLKSHLGPEAEVRAWHLGSREPLQPLEVLKTAGVTAGWDTHAQKPTAVISLKP
ncbi:hypothetical protein [Prosthecobacter vanneervenii]|uniref:Uncharacterized protein n=1 Tax=Prosthecobacter vanneervenii TaxID=48466 RepID=A0A7W8DIY8_9BACT|nr:hypothetical protein [Prosthecobacter vanneervenii]MBB5031475.1 hypothetical protein [Prosthecobacter vanneervenii]